MPLDHDTVGDLLTLDEELIVISDLHLGPGPHECVEGFANDSVFDGFVTWLLERADHEGRHWRLVLLGDSVDFLRAQLVTNPEGLPCTEEVARVALERVVSGHPLVVEALRRFVDHGFGLDVVLGNHDLELLRPALQQRLRDALGGGDVRFFPWIYHVPGLLYAEHGSQYDDLNAFTTLLDPVAGPAGEFEQPVGTFLFMKGQRTLLSFDPCLDHATPPRDYFRLARKADPSARRRLLGANARLAGRVVAHARSLSGTERSSRRACYRETILADYAAGVGLSHGALLALDGLSSATTAPVAALARQVAIRTARRVRPARPIPAGGTDHYLARAASTVHSALRRSGEAEPLYVFGHTHVARHLPLALGAGAPQYVNTGTWSSVLNARSDTLRTIRPTFVEVRRGTSPPSPPVARLLTWRGPGAVAETLRFQA